MNTKDQVILNVASLRLARAVRANLINFPPSLHADFLTLSNFIEEFDHATEAIEIRRETAER